MFKITISNTECEYRSKSYYDREDGTAAIKYHCSYNARVYGVHTAGMFPPQCEKESCPRLKK